MGIILFWITGLSVMLVIIANLAAWISRWRWRLIGKLLLAIIGLAILGNYQTQSYLIKGIRLSDRLYFAHLAQMAMFASLGGWIAIAALSRSSTAPNELRGVQWPRGKLAVGLVTALLLHFGLFWQLDRSARQHLTRLQSENVSLALSVAPRPLSDADNARVIYAEAARSLGDADSWPSAYKEKWLGWLNDDYAGFNANDVELRAFLRQHEMTLALLRDASVISGCRFERDYLHPSYEMLLSLEFLPLRHATRLLLLEARCLAADGDQRSALANYRTMFTIAKHISSDPVLMAQWISAAIDGAAIQALQAELASERSNPEDLASLDISPGSSRQREFQHALIMERAIGASAILTMASGTGKLMDEPTTPVWRLVGAPVYRIFVLDEEYAGYCQRMEQAAQWASEPYFQLRAQWTDFDKSTKRTPGIFNRLLFPAASQTAVAVARNEAGRNLCRLAIAAYRYQATHGKLPLTIDELAPAFMATIPRDPFSDGPLRTKLNEQSLVIYSLGPDFDDDGGIAYDYEAKSGDLIFEVKKYTAAAASKP